ncbi:MAG: pH-response regulator protein palA/rim20 [Pleopsidium flavum]|nr:MAG: pH-response regulator protein palA/rim20 [Pleopsidium flavum]
MSSNILFLPFRRTHSISLSAAIRQYISTKYDQHPDMFKHDLEAIDRLRADAVTSLEPHVSGIRKLAAYAAQLVWIGGKFPIDIDFSVVSQNNLRFELANILYNLASLYSQLAISTNRSTSDGLKTACNYFCVSAGVISYLKTHIIPDLRSTPPEDMDTMTLECLQHLLLAQAQECFWQKAVKDGLKDASIAKLAAKVSDFYSQAGDFGIKSDAISTEWIHHMTAKHHHFAAAAQYRAACDCLEKRKYGEEVARLRDSLNCVNEAMKEARWINKMVLGDLNGLKNRVSEDLKRAEKDNDLIYLIPVPPKSELKALERASMATAKVPKEIADPSSMLGDHGVFGQPLFAKLVPYAVHIAASIYVERKDRLVNTIIIDELEGLTTNLRDLLQSLSLPGSLQALEKPLGLPPTLISHAEEIRQQDGLNRLRRSMDDIAKLKANDKSTYAEGIELLKSEAAEDERARKRYGTDRWTRPTSQEAAEKLYVQVGEIDGYLNSANSSDELVRGKLKDCEGVLRVLAGSDRDLEESVPSSRRATLTPRVEKETGRLRASLNEVNGLESRRRRKIQTLREKAASDDINPSILAEAARLEREYPMQKIEPAQFEELFEKRLERYDSDRTMVVEEQEEQAGVTSRVKEANAAFLQARRGDSSTKERERALQKLENGYFKYKEIVSNLDVGRKFYNDLAKIVARFKDDCKGFAYQRRTEAGQLESDLTNAMSSLTLSQANSLQHEKQEENLRSSYKIKAHVDEPLTAPTPTRAAVPPPLAPASLGVWTPEMGIQFGGGPSQQNNQNVHAAPYPNTSNAQLRGGPWDPSRGLRFS